MQPRLIGGNLVIFYVISGSALIEPDALFVLVNIVASYQIVVRLIDRDPIDISVGDIVLHDVVVRTSVQHDPVQFIIVRNVAGDLIVEASFGSYYPVSSIIVNAVVGDYQIIGVVVRVNAILDIVKNFIVPNDNSGGAE